MPFKSKAQVRACFAQKNPQWDCKAWAKETKRPLSKLPEKVASKQPPRQTKRGK